MKRIFAILFVLIFVLALFSGCSAAKTETTSSAPSESNASSSTDTSSESDAGSSNPYTSKENLVIGLSAEPSTLDIHRASLNSVNASVQTAIFSTLVDYDSDANDVLPNVATSWEFTDDTTLKVVIRDDVYSQNGTHLTASDVVYSINRGASFASLANTYNKIDAQNCEVIDDYTLNIKLTEPYSPIIMTLALAPLGLVCQADVEAVGDEEFTANPVGTGPYVFTEWKTGESIVLTRDDNYWGEMPQWETLTFKFIPDNNARALAVQSGDVDFAEKLSSSQVSSLENDANVTVHLSDINETQVLWFNLSNQYLSDPLVREALELAIDRDAILQSVYDGLGVIADSVFSSTSNQYAPPTSTEHSYNVEKAKELLEEAGYPDGFDIGLCCYESQDLVNILQIVQNTWASIGVNAEISTMDKGTYFTKLYAGEFDIYCIHEVGRAPDARITFFDSGLTGGGGNLTGYTSQQFDELFSLATIETDTQASNEYYMQIGDLLRIDRPMIPLVETSMIGASGKGLTNVKIGPTSYILYYQLKAE